MAGYTFFTHPMSRGQVARWALHEVAADYHQVLVEWQAKPPELLAANPMGKLPTIIHHAPEGDRVVTEAAAICHYLAEIHPGAGLLPSDREKADYFRWLFFAAGPVESAITARALQCEPTPEQQVMAGWGSLERTVRTLAGHFADHDYVCGPRFTMADVYVGSAVDFGMNFGSLPPEPPLVAYAERYRERPAFRAAKAIDNALIAEKRT
ncbi:MAG: glutathione S-transferase family protein [Sphingomonadales bacterium]|nr:glutathione S-transferase family protein [Sphingomonadales bacterium]